MAPDHNNKQANIHILVFVTLQQTRFN